MVQNASHPCNFAMQRFDTPFLCFMRNIGRHSAKRASPRGKWRRNRAGNHDVFFGVAMFLGASPCSLGELQKGHQSPRPRSRTTVGTHEGAEAV